MKYQLLAVLARCGIGVAHAKDSRDDTTFLDRGVLTHASSQGVLRLDVATGAFEIRYSDGRIYRDALTLPPMDRNALSRVPFMILGGGSVAKTETVCTSEAGVLAQPANLVTSACANGQSLFCNSARSTLDFAMEAFNDCLLVALSPTGGGGSPPTGGQPGNPPAPGNTQPGAGQPGNGQPGSGGPEN